MDKFTIIIQGPLHRHSLSRLQKYRAYGEVIISTGKNSYDNNTKVLPYFNSEDTYLLTYPDEVPNTTFNCFNTYYQCLGVLTALEKVQTPFVIKVRADNYIGNLNPMIDKIIASQKIVTGNLYFRPDHVQKYCPCDQTFGGKTDVLLKAFQIAKHRLENHSKELREAYNDHRQTTNELYLPLESGSTVPNASEPMERGKGISPEVLIGTSMLAALGITLDPTISRNQMLSAFEIVTFEEMKPYLSKAGDSIIPHGGLEINSIEEI